MENGICDRALAIIFKIGAAVELAQKRELSELEQQGLIQAFEFTHELAWKTLKDFLEYRGTTGIYGSRDATRKAFRLGLISEGEIWMDMIQSRHKASHTYNEETAQEIVTLIQADYWAEFIELEETLSQRSIKCPSPKKSLKKYIPS